VHVAAEFELTGACEIARWQRKAAPLGGRVKGTPPGRS
jgi:hypothetical protein